jgi:hypothetical protein
MCASRSSCLELADAGLHPALLVLGGVVLGVLAQVAVAPRLLDLGGDLLAALGLERLELGLEAVVGILAEVRLGHGGFSVPMCGLKLTWS